MKSSKLSIIDRAKGKIGADKVLTGARTILKLNDRVLPFVSNVKIEIGARGVATATIKMFLTELEFNNQVKVNGVYRPAKKNKANVVGRYTKTIVRSTRA